MRRCGAERELEKRASRAIYPQSSESYSTSDPCVTNLVERPHSIRNGGVVTSPYVLDSIPNSGHPLPIMDSSVLNYPSSDMFHTVP